MPVQCFTTAWPLQYFGTILKSTLTFVQDMGMGGQVYDRSQIEQMYGKGGENFPGALHAL